MQTVRDASRAEAHVRAGRWRDGLHSTPDIRDLTLGIVGLGTIGKVNTCEHEKDGTYLFLCQIVQKQVEALGMTVIYNNRRRLPPEGMSILLLSDDLQRSSLLAKQMKARLHTYLSTS